jgi:sodium/bile acid cotransporter 7
MESTWKRIQNSLVKNYLPISFAVALAWALAWPYPGQQVVNVTVLDKVHIVQDMCVGCVFFISGLVLDTQDLRRVRGSLSAFIFGLGSILFLTPCLGFALRYLPLQPKELCIGLVLFCLVPTTLGVGQVLVRSCQGNESVAVLLIITSNMLGLLTMPIWLKFIFVGYDIDGLSLNMDIPDLFIQLSLTILAPSVVGKVLQESSAHIKGLVKKYRTHLSLLSTSMLALVIWQTLSGARNTIFETQPGYIVAVIAIASAVHIFYLVANYYALR